MNRLSKRSFWFGSLIVLGLLTVGGYAMGFVLPEVGVRSSADSSAAPRMPAGRPWLEPLSKGNIAHYKALLAEKNGDVVEVLPTTCRRPC